MSTARATELAGEDPARGRHDVWLTRGAWGVVCFSCVQILLFGFGRDQGIYAAVADSLLAGGMPYRDAWDFKPPGIFFVFAFAQALFGKAMVSVRIVECLGLVSMVVACRRIGRDVFDSRVAGLLGGALAALIHAELEFWHTAQPESFGGILTMWALSLAVGRGARASSFSSRAIVWATCGVLFGSAFLLKPPLGGVAMPVALYFVGLEWRAGRRALALVPVGVVAGASVVPIACTAWWFHARGAWPALSWTLFEFTPGYTRLGWHGTPLELLTYGFREALTGFSFFLLPALLAALALPPSGPRERPAVGLLLGVVAMQVVGIALQAKFFQYHFGATLPVLSLVAGLGACKVFRLASRAGASGIALFLAASAALIGSRVALRHNPGTFWERSGKRLAFLVTRSPSREELDRDLYYVADYDLDVDRNAARAVARLAAPSDSIFVWGFEPAVYWFSGRRSASRYVYDVPQRALWGREKARTDLLADLSRDVPAVVVVQHGDYFNYVTGDELDSYAALETFPELARWLEDGYVFAEAVEDLDVYRRRWNQRPPRMPTSR